MKDFIYLNVPGLLCRYTNPPPDRKNKIIAFAATEISFFDRNGLISKDAPALKVPTEEAIIRFSDFTPEGQDFIMSQAVERWLESCDRKGTIEAYEDSSGLVRRLTKFRKRRSTLQ